MSVRHIMQIPVSSLIWSLIRDQKSSKHIANGYKKLLRTFKRETVQFLVAKNLAENDLPLETLPAV